MPKADPDAGARRNEPALVVFADNTDLKFLRSLRRGFRHCFVAVHTAGGWVICDPLSHQTDLSIVDGFSPEELAAWYRNYDRPIPLGAAAPVHLRRGGEARAGTACPVGRYSLAIVSATASAANDR
jgi:hypothetical protein